MKINVKRLTASAMLPTRGSSEAAGLDLYADNESSVQIAPGDAVYIHTGIAVAIPAGYFGGIFARSGIASKRGLRPANCTGVIDADYRGEVMVCLRNDTDLWQEVKPHERIAQLIVQRYEPVELQETDELDATERGNGGFGSTGRQ